MGFVELENAGKRLLERFPAVKHFAKRVYQLAGYALSRERFKSEGEVTRLTPDDGYEYYFGYYDKSPWDADDKRLIALRVKESFRSVAPAEPGEIVLLDSAGGAPRHVAIAHAWNVQQGCMAQWLGPDFRRRLLFNDFRDGKYCAVIFDTERMAEERVLPLPVYDVSRDGRFALSLDFSRLHRLRPGYGYSNLPEATAGELCPDAPCIWRMELDTGAVTPLLKYTDFAAFEPDETMRGAEHKVNHLMIRPDGKRFMVLHRWFQNGRKHTRLVTVNSDGTEMYNLSDDVFVSHCFWKNNEEILSFLRKKETGNHYYLMRDRTQEYRLLWPELRTDGHCSYSPDGRFVVTDTYPNRKRLLSVYLCSDEENCSARIARVFAPFKYDNNCRCDLHPRWSRSGDRICIDSVHEGRRAMYAIPVRPEALAEEAQKPVRVLVINTVPMVYDGITMVILNYLTNMSRQGLQIDLVSINDVEDSLRATIEAAGARLYTIKGRNRKPWSYVPKLAKLIRKNRYQVVHAHGNSCTLAFEMLAARLGGAKARCAHSHNTKSTNPRAHKLLRPLFDRCVNHGFACGQEAGRWLFPKKPFTVLNNGIDTEKYRFNAAYREEYRQKLGIGDRIAVGHVAHFTYHKNHTFLIDAFERVAKADDRYVLVLVGDGKLRPEIERKVREKGLSGRVIFTGTSLEIPQILSAMDFMVLPSLFEGLPNVLIEWQSSGLPSLVADTVTQEAKLTGLVTFLPLEEQIWADAILGMDTDIDRERTSGEARKEIAEKGFDIVGNAERLRELYLLYGRGA